ncbi:MAG: hypothetical protein ABL889_16735 [Terricaulis sp.]
MSPPNSRAIRDAIWEAMIDRAEALHDNVVAGQVRASSFNAGKIGDLAGELYTLARAAALLNPKRHA